MVSITASHNGPYIVQGDVELQEADGTPIPVERSTLALCRCGGSKTKPFCDGTHAKIGFLAPLRAVQDHERQ
jgi:CDGSH-type Zn-finger protein